MKPGALPCGGGHADVRDPRSRPRAPSAPLLRRPRFMAVNVQVSVARTHGSKASPLVASRPLGTSTLRTGTPESLMARIALACGSRGALRNPVPRIASMTSPEPVIASCAAATSRETRTSTPQLRARVHVAAHDAADLRLVCDDEGAHRAAPGGELTRRDQPVATVVAMPCNNSDTVDPAGHPRPRAAGDLPTGDLHELERRDTAIERCRVEPRPPAPT